MFKKKNEFKTTSKIDYGFIKWKAREALANAYVEADKHDRAVRTFNEVEALRVQAWENVYELYPKLNGKALSHNQYSHLITVKE